MNKRKINIKEIKLLINQGKKKQEIFEELKKKYQPPLELAKQIEKFPTLENKKKYKSNNVTLIVLLSISLFFDLVGLNYGGIIWDISLIYIVATFQAEHYQWISFRAGFSVLVVLAMLFFTEYSLLSIISVSISLLILIPTFILAIKLEKKLCPNFIKKKIRYTDSNGKVKLKLKIEFID